MRIPWLFLAIGSSLLAADPPNPAGDWKGSLKAGATELRVVLHLQQSAGQWKASLDSIDQGVNGIPASTVTVEGRQLKLQFPAVKGDYEGSVSEDNKTVTGTWTQAGNAMPLGFTRGSFDTTAENAAMNTAAMSTEPLLGSWEGTLEVGPNKLRLRFNIVKDDKGRIAGTFDSIDQNVNGMPITGLNLRGSAFHFDLKGVGGQYDGTVNEDRTLIKGTWRQSGVEAPLDWKKVAKPTGGA